MYKIIGADQKEYGPISADQLRQWISEGRVNAHTKVQAADSTEWKAMAELPEFATIVPRPAPPLPRYAPGTIVPHSPAAGTSQMAIWALVTGIMSVLCCCQILAPVSIVLGAVALSQLKHHPEQRGAGFAIAGIILGVIALLLLLTSIAVFVSNPSMLQNLQNSLPQP
jgi:hypothetical protein